MTDTTNPNPVPPVVVPPVVAPPDGTVADLTSKLAEATAKLAEATSRAGQFAQQITTLTAERETFVAKMAALETRAVKADELAVKVTDMTNAQREGSLVDALRAKLPGADPLAIRGVLGELHKAGKANRFAEDTAAELAKVLPVITTEAPGLTRPPTSGGGSPGARVTPAAPGRKSLVG